MSFESQRWWLAAVLSTSGLHPAKQRLLSVAQVLASHIRFRLVLWQTQPHLLHRQSLPTRPLATQPHLLHRPVLHSLQILCTPSFAIFPITETNPSILNWLGSVRTYPLLAENC